MKTHAFYKSCKRSGAYRSVQTLVICLSLFVTGCSDVKFEPKSIESPKISVQNPTGGSAGGTTSGGTSGGGTTSGGSSDGSSSGGSSSGDTGTGSVCHAGFTPAFQTCQSTSDCCWENGDYCGSTATSEAVGGGPTAACRPRQNQDCLMDLHGTPPIAPQSWPDGYPIWFC